MCKVRKDRVAKHGVADAPAYMPSLVPVLANSLVASVLSLLHAYQLRQRAASLGDYQTQTTTITPGGPSLCFSWGGDLLVIGIIANYAAVAADTFSSELGILARGPPRLITSLTLRKVPPGTNGGVTLTGLAAGLVGSMTMVTTAMFFIPFCNDMTANKIYGGSPWKKDEFRTLMAALTLWGALGSVLDSFLGGLLQRSVRDVRTGKIVEGEGGVRVLVSSSGRPDQNLKRASVKAAALSGEGKDAVAKAGSAVGDGQEKDRYDPKNKHRKSSFGNDRPTRVIESGWDILDNNGVNFLMAFTMSVGAMAGAASYWGQPMATIFQV